MFVQVCGAARAVTGSCFLVEVGDTRFLVDCGMHQGGDKEEALNYERFSFDADELDFVLLTHAHIDHSGRLPRLVKEGFSGPIYATAATCDLAEIMLLDSAYIQETEAEWRSRKARRAGRKDVQPMYDQDDARKTLPLLQPVQYHERRKLAPGVEVVFRDAGHILGSAILELYLEEAGTKAKVVFSGDVGQPDQPIIRDPEIIEEADYLFLESTYGDRLHERNGEPKHQFTEILKEAHRTGGNVIIPAFAVGRTQEVLYYLREIFAETDLDMPVYVDSPMATNATEVFRQHHEVFDEEAWKIVSEPGGIFDFPMLDYTESAEESKKLNEKKGIVIISASGMADAGRVRHHLKHNLWKPESHVVIVGFQAQGSMGRRLRDGVDEVKMFGDEIAVKAKVHELTGLSAHADQEQLLDWASHVRSPRLVILNHGEETAVLTLKGLLEEKLDFKVAVADMNEVFDLGKAPRRRQ
ncbi:MAG: MBL fold metallo-hydrolase [Actinobacteria bacterium]|nr:MBL fold metallo-hydrolase [Actinomycetota bacterium]